MHGMVGAYYKTIDSHKNLWYNTKVHNKKAPRREHWNWRSNTPHDHTDGETSE